VRLLISGDFETGVTTGWNTYSDATLEVVRDPTGEGANALRVANNTAGADFWNAGLQHLGHMLEQGKSGEKSAPIRAWKVDRLGPGPSRSRLARRRHQKNP